MKRVALPAFVLVLVVFVLLGACEPSAPARMTFALGHGSASQNLALSDIDGFQVAVVDPDKEPNFNCGLVSPPTMTCLNASSGYASKNLVPLSKKENDKTAPAVYFPASLDGSGNQAVTVYGIPVGSGYSVVVEVRSKSSQLIGSTCFTQKQINAGANTAELPAITLLDAGVACDPLIQ